MLSRNKEFYNDNMICHCRRQGPGEHIHQLPQGGDSKNRKMSDGQSRHFQKNVISGNPIFGKIDPIKLFESLVNSKVLKGITKLVNQIYKH